MEKINYEPLGEDAEKQQLQNTEEESSIDPIALTPEQEDLLRQRKMYEKQAKKDARIHNTFLENVTGRGLDKEDIMRTDAIHENKLQERAKNGAKNGLWEMFVGHTSKEELDERLLNEQISALSLNIDSSPTLRTHNKSLGFNYPIYSLFKFTLEGMVNGRKITVNGYSIYHNKDDFNRIGCGVDRTQDGYGFSGEIDGETISDQVAQEIFEKYQMVAVERWRAIEKTKQVPQIRKEIERLNKSNEEAVIDRDKFKDIL